MNPKSIFPIVLVGFGLVAAFYLMTGALSASTSSISYLVRWGGIGLAVMAFLRPKLGLYIVTAEAFSTDYIKKVAVYYGNTSTLTIMEVMVVVMLALVATFAGRLAQLAMGGGKKTSVEEWAFYLIGFLVAMAVFLKTDGGMLSAGQQAFNIGVYIGVGGLMIGLLKDSADLWKYYRFAMWFGVAWCLMAIKQSEWGYSDLEIYYAKTGLSEVATNQFFLSLHEKPRPSGFGSGAPNLGAIIVFFAIGLWAAMNVSKKYWIVVLLVLGTALLSQIKSMIAVCLIIAVAYPVCKRRFTVGMGYAVGILVIGSMVYFSQEILANLEDIDRSFRGAFNLSDSWSIQTFSDRLYGWTELKDPKNWAWGPSKRQFRSHDEVAGLLKSVGGLGVVVIGLFLAWFLTYFHRVSFQTAPGPMRSLAACLTAFVVVSIVVGAAVGGFLKGQPQGLVVWFSAGGVFLLAQEARRIRREAIRAEPRPAARPEVQAGPRFRPAARPEGRRAGPGFRPAPALPRSAGAVESGG